MSRTLILAVLAAVLAVTPLSAATVTVTVGSDFAFHPQEVRIQPGDTVTWTLAGGFHNMHFDDGSVTTETFPFSHTFNAAGTQGYHCTFHGSPGSGMFGRVVVASAGVNAPTNLRGEARSATEIQLTWNDNSTNESGFQIERRQVGGDFEVVGTTGANGSGTATANIAGLDPGEHYLFRVRALGAGSAVSAYSNVAGIATSATPGPCVADANTLCLNNNRFKVQVTWHTVAGNTGQGFAVPLPAAPESGLFYFFSATNIEMLIKALNACVDPFNSYWVYFAATTNVEFAVVVTDTQTGKTKPYYNPLNQAAQPVQDGNAFPCP
jgi:plastocyanin